MLKEVAKNKTGKKKANLQSLKLRICYQAVILALPFAILRAITLRPPGVSFLAKNPCFRFRLMLLGWYVLLVFRSIGVNESGAPGRDASCKRNGREGQQWGLSKSFTGSPGSSKMGRIFNLMEPQRRGEGTLLLVDWTDDEYERTQVSMLLRQREAAPRVLVAIAKIFWTPRYFQ